MFARSSYLLGEPSKIDDLVAYVRDVVTPVTERLIGNLGVEMWVHRSSGQMLVRSTWADEASMRAAESAVDGTRAGGEALLDDHATVERHEIVLVDPTLPHRIGSVMRLANMHCDADQLQQNVAWWRRQVLPTLRSVPGFLGYVAGVDAASGSFVVAVTFADGIAADVAHAATGRQRDAAPSHGITIDAVTTYEVAIESRGILQPSAPAPRRTYATGTTPRTTPV